MASERYVDPAVGQALEEAREALRTEQASQGTLASQNAQLRERAQRLEAERAQLRGELERLRQGQVGPMPRLPEVLATPFEVRPLVRLRRHAREALPMLLLVVLAVLSIRSGTLKAWVLFGASVVFMLVQLLIYWNGRLPWRFEEEGIKARESEVPGNLLRYRDILGVEAYSSNRQRMRGLGSVTVRFMATTGQEKQLLLKDVPEPERLAEWLEARRQSAGQGAARQQP